LRGKGRAFYRKRKVVAVVQSLVQRKRDLREKGESKRASKLSRGKTSDTRCREKKLPGRLRKRRLKTKRCPWKIWV